MTEWNNENKTEKRDLTSDKGGTMRLGSYRAVLKKGSKIHNIYNSDEISERHRHRYEVDLSYTKDFEQKGFHFSGMSPDNILPEVIESVNHKWFIGVQFHPELKSRPLAPHPLFSSFIKHCIK
jgi:CTP synthase